MTLRVKHCFIVFIVFISHYQVMLDTIGKRIKYAIIDSGLTQSYIADKCGVTKQAITGWIKTNSIDKKNLMILSKLTGFNIDWFINGSNNYKKQQQNKTHGVNEQGAKYTVEAIELAVKITNLSAKQRAQLTTVVNAFNIKLDKKTKQYK